VLRIVGALQQLQRHRPPAFILENTAMQYNFRSPGVSSHDFNRVVAALGRPLLLDAVQVGSFAHRLRDYWQNLAPPPAVARVLANVARPTLPDQQLQGWVVQDPDRVVAVVENNDVPP
jgi:hypothetical protein